MKVVEINSVPYGSTGTIASSISKVSKKYGESYFCYSWTKNKKNHVDTDEILIGSFIEKLFHVIFGKITGLEGTFSFFSTRRLISKIDKIKPDIVHLHNLHCWYINYKVLFDYLKNEKIQVVWTLHDCWAFTGHCPYFEIVNCEKWKTCCYQCPIYKEYPQSLFDNSKKMYLKKKKIFTSLDYNKLCVVTPSLWLSKLVKESFLKKYKCFTINNGIDLNIFKPKKSNFREKYNIGNKFIILGVSMDWGIRKGLDVFIKLSNDLNDNFKIVLVGTNDEIDKILPKSIISIHRTYSKSELAEIYSTADLFVNPTREDNFPTVNIEAIACGTKVLTYNTGGSYEMLDETCGFIVDKNDYIGLKNKIISISSNYVRCNKERMKKAEEYNENVKYLEYLDLFNKLMENYDKNE